MSELKFKIKSYLVFAIIVVYTLIALISSKPIKTVINKYTFSILIIVFIQLLNLGYYIELTLLWLITLFILINLFVKLFFTPIALQFFSLFQQKILDQSHLLNLETDKRIVIESLNKTAIIIHKKYFAIIISIYFFFYATISFIILILSGSVLLNNVYLHNNNAFNIPMGYRANFWDFILMSVNSFLLTDHSLISSNSYFINVILTIHSFIFIIVTIACIHLLSIKTNYEPISLKKNKVEANNMITDFNFILQNQGIIQALVYYFRKADKNK